MRSLQFIARWIRTGLPPSRRILKGSSLTTRNRPKMHISPLTHRLRLATTRSLMTISKFRLAIIRSLMTTSRLRLAITRSRTPIRKLHLAITRSRTLVPRPLPNIPMATSSRSLLADRGRRRLPACDLTATP
jgi:hypothetical protein